MKINKQLISSSAKCLSFHLFSDSVDQRVNIKATKIEITVSGNS